MTTLRADPWMPEYGMGFEVSEEDPEAVDASVESDDWSQARLGRRHTGPLWFVDGVRRVELRVHASEGARRAPGLFGSFAVGSVRSEKIADLGTHRVQRWLIIGGGLTADPIALSSLSFAPESEPRGDPDAPLVRLQTLMRAAEAELAKTIAADAGCVVFADGPLAYTFYDVPTASPVVGVVKRSLREYLDGAHADLLARLRAGERTPLFAIGDEGSRKRRYSWYIRLSSLHGPLHERAGLARCEVRFGLGLNAAVSIADLAAGTLPAFTGHPWDVRTPQNLVPIAALERWLRHRMGDTRLVRRALLVHLAEAA